MIRTEGDVSEAERGRNRVAFGQMFLKSINSRGEDSEDSLFKKANWKADLDALRELPEA